MFTGTGIHWNEPKAEQRISNSCNKFLYIRNPYSCCYYRWSMVNIPGWVALLMLIPNWNVTFGYQFSWRRHLLFLVTSGPSVSPLQCKRSRGLVYLHCAVYPITFPLTHPKGQKQEWRIKVYPDTSQTFMVSRFIYEDFKLAKWKK